MNLFYETKRLELRTLDEKGASLVYEYYLRNREFLKEWEPVRTDEFYTLSFHHNQLRMEAESIQKGNLLRLWMFPKDDRQKPIGMISFSNIVRGAFLSCNLGYSMDGTCINQGYVTEAIEKGIDVIFNDYKLHRIEANIMPRNIRSRRVCEKLGFREEGLAREYLKINGKWEDHIHMVIINDKLD